MTTRSTIFYGLCALVVVLCTIQSAAAIKCFVCPGNKLSNCAPPSELTKKVVFEEFNCTDFSACGRLISWNPNAPTQKNYVGLRNTVRNLEYRFCASDKWTGCYKSESAITSSIECVCTSDNCNEAGRQAAGPWALTACLLLAAWAVGSAAA